MTKVKTPSTKVSKLALTHIVQQLSKVVNNVEVSRTTLCQVHAYKKDSSWVLEATDGHRFVSNVVDESEIETNLGESLSFRSWLLPEFKLALSKVKKSPDSEMIDLEKLPESCSESDFPDTSRLASEYGYEWSIAFNAEYLEEMLQAMRSHKRTRTVLIKMRSPTHPIKVTCGENTYGLLMPVRDSTFWAEAAAKEAEGAK